MSPEVQAFASGFPLMLLQLGLGLVLFALACAAYALLSPNQEVRRIRTGDVAAAVSFAGAMIGLAIPAAASLIATGSVVELALWATAALVLTLLAFRLIDVALSGLPQRMREGEVGAAVVLVGARLAVALIIAAAVVV
jgi:putative membrane protein